MSNKTRWERLSEFYEISTDGDIRRSAYIHAKTGHAKAPVVFWRAHEAKQGTIPKVRLWDGVRYYEIEVYRLMASAFLPSYEFGKSRMIYKDKNPANLSLANLEAGQLSTPLAA